MLRRPPRSTLFPTRRSSDLRRLQPVAAVPRVVGRVGRERRQWHGGIEEQAGRSEEHTSELQSRQYLVCRLLLEKKKKKKSEQAKHKHHNGNRNSTTAA